MCGGTLAHGGLDMLSRKPGFYKIGIFFIYRYTVFVDKVLLMVGPEFVNTSITSMLHSRGLC